MEKLRVAITATYDNHGVNIVQTATFLHCTLKQNLLSSNPYIQVIMVIRLLCHIFYVTSTMCETYCVINFKHYQV